MNDEVEKLDQDHGEARRAHEVLFHGWMESYRSTIQIGLEAMRAAALINGGAVAAGLAFAGTIYEEDKPAAAAVLLAVSWFVWGVIFSGASSAFAYFAQLLYTAHAGEVEPIWEHPYLRHPGLTWRAVFGAIFHTAAILSVAASYAFLLWGVSAASKIL